MEEATMQTIINAVLTFLSTGVGATVLGIVIKAIVTAVANVKTRKYSKLTEADREAIVEEVKSGVLQAIHGGVSVDMDAQLDKATARRITAVEKSQNEIVAQTNKLMDYQRTVLAAIGDFKTISQASKERIQGILKDEAATLEKVSVVEQGRIEIKQEAPEIQPVKSSVTY